MSFSHCTTAAVAVAVLLGCVSLAGCKKAPPPGGRAHGRGGGARDVELIELFAPWNPASKMQASVTSELALEYAGRAKITRIDVEAEPEALARYGVESSPPAFVLLVDGKVSRRMTGLQSADELRAALDEPLGGAPQSGTTSNKDVQD